MAELPHPFPVWIWQAPKNIHSRSAAPPYFVTTSSTNVVTPDSVNGPGLRVGITQDATAVASPSRTPGPFRSSPT
ncbi:hypothetical protein [Actinomadura kijaniata]|uniref:hypothetical protein n=1 Tax=Actinomadura kijaniata TaxID=46161 RepID=UPI0012FC009B|nr:hypothetical protein [Actinomadura kijaniata]